MALADITLDPEQREQLLSALPFDLRLQVVVHDVVVRFLRTIASVGLQSFSEAQERAMDLTVDIHIAELEKFKGRLLQKDQCICQTLTPYLIQMPIT
jgi:hypothetical protein